jgi:hypothetical protein
MAIKDRNEKATRKYLTQKRSQTTIKKKREEQK